MRGMDVGCAGNLAVRTPSLDQLAREGTRFTHALATTPVCGPNRAVLLTGLYPTANKVPGNDLPLPTTLPSLGTIARSSGFQTAYIGKWHLDGLPRSRFTPLGARRHGFDYWAAYNCAHDYFHPRYYRDSPEPILAEGYEPEVQTDLAIDYLKHCRRDAPFCLLLSWGPPHDPYDQVPQRYRDMYDPAAIILRPNVVADSGNPLAAGKDCRRTICDYYAAITALDDQMGRLLAALDETGRADDTLVVFTSDHGDMLWSHGWMKKQSPYSEAVSVPLIMRWPGVVPGGAASDCLFGTVDMLPTLAALLGWKCPPMQGTDLSPAVLGRAGFSGPGSLLLAHYLAADEAETQQMPEWRAVLTQSHTYVERPGRVPWLLFDNTADPYQQRNLVRAGDAEQGRLRAELSGWLESTADSFLPGPELLDHLGLGEAWRERERDIRKPEG